MMTPRPQSGRRRDEDAMTPSEIVEAVRGHAPDAVKEAFPDDLHPRLHTEAVHWRDMARFLHDDPALAFDWLGCLTGVDYVAEDRLCAVYDLYATTLPLAALQKATAGPLGEPTGCECERRRRPSASGPWNFTGRTTCL